MSFADLLHYKQVLLILSLHLPCKKHYSHRPIFDMQAAHAVLTLPLKIPVDLPREQTDEWRAEDEALTALTLYFRELGIAVKQKQQALSGWDISSDGHQPQEVRNNVTLPGEIAKREFPARQALTFSFKASFAPIGVLNKCTGHERKLTSVEARLQMQTSGQTSMFCWYVTGELYAK